MTEKPPLWADLLLTIWVGVVAVIFFGVFIDPRIGLWTDTASAVYVALVLVAAVVLAVKYLRRHDAPRPPASENKTRNE